ncbi:MAG: L,D-transpeptidase family protein [Myxococcota bacterium]
MVPWLVAAAAFAGPDRPVPPQTRQLVLVVAPEVDGSAATVRLATRDADGWHAVGAPIPARIGANGVAWGIGLHPPQPGLQKVEGDERSPAGVFRLGAAYRDDSIAPLQVAWPVQHVGARDLWVEDPASPYYNLHLVVPGTRALQPWEEQNRMILDNPVLSLKVAVQHNAPPGVISGAGSAIFLHTWGRDGRVGTSGCTSVARSDLVRIIEWLDPAGAPVLALLTEADLARLGDAWGLPPASLWGP